MGNSTYHYGKVGDQHLLFLNHHFYLSVICLYSIAVILIYICFTLRYCDHFLSLAKIFEKMQRNTNIPKSTPMRELRRGSK